MLVLTRRINESIVINGDITVTVLEVGRNGQVRLGIDAPRQVQIYRQELLMEIQRENRSALDSAASAGTVSHAAARRDENTPTALPITSA